MRWGSAYALFACVACSISGPALAQNTTGGGTPPAAPTPAPDNKLPPVEVIQKQAQPAPKAIQQQAPPKKKIVQPAPQPAPAPQQPAAVTVPGTGGIDTGTVQMSPVQGSSIPISKYPGAVGRASASDIDRAKLPSAPELLQQTVPSALISDAQGNIYQRDLQYRGFEASPVNGVAQGIAVYQNGVRINESFGDIVNWDFLPDNAIEGITIVGANPVFGLNAIGGAATIVMRDGFNFQGVEVDSRYGSFGHIQGSVAAGARSGNWGAFIAGEDIKDDGFRDFSEAKIRRMYADLGVKGDGNEFHLNFTGADNFVGVTAAAPVQLLDLGWSRTFTSPQTTENKMAMVSANGSVKATPSLTFSGVGYYRWFQQQHADGNIAEAVECAAPGVGTLCWDDNDPATNTGARPERQYHSRGRWPGGRSRHRPARLDRQDQPDRQQLGRIRCRASTKRRSQECRTSSYSEPATTTATSPTTPAASSASSARCSWSTRSESLCRRRPTCARA